MAQKWREKLFGRSGVATPADSRRANDATKPSGSRAVEALRSGLGACPAAVEYDDDTPTHSFELLFEALHALAHRLLKDLPFARISVRFLLLSIFFLRERREKRERCAGN